MRQVNWGIIGLGAVALQFAKGFNFVNNAKLLGIASKNPYKLNQFKEEFIINSDYCFNEYQSLLENKEKKKIKAIRKVYPQRISEAEPKNVGGN